MGPITWGHTRHQGNYRLVRLLEIDTHCAQEYITTPSARLDLTVAFSHQVHRRLLHAGATTTHILNIYISIIRAFNELDSKGVLLDRVSRPIRRYLREREDTARIIVASLLADVEDDNGQFIDPGPEISIEIAKEMLNPITAFDEHDQDMDWDNMNWTPDPIDAGPDYQKAESSDVTASLLSLYDREDFINELKTILGEHLLRNEDSRFEKEERLLELFKHRLGDDKLQACEVMLHDVQQSRRINAQIQRYPGFMDVREQGNGVTLNAQILSSFFWPSLKDEDFAVPPPIKELQDQYEKGFEGIKDMRKLEWLPALGRVTVELEFEDRRVEEVVPTWTASVIYAFQESGHKNQAVKKSVEELCEALTMEESLVRNALVFWLGKHVLREESSDVYTVIERLSTQSASEDATAQAAQTLMDAEATVTAVKSQTDIMNENSELYRQFVVNMLTNQGKLPLMRIWMMLKVVVPGGFPFGVEEVRALLEDLVQEGKVVGQGDIYGVKRE
jgi:anaphase-promoting complex subunit 2